jgi:SAM-dependent methyltransferase
MFWTKALPSEQLDAEQIRRNFGVIEAPDSAMFLTSVTHILATGLGYRSSMDQRVCVLGDGRPIPMMSYSLIEYLLGLDLGAFEVLELGGGSSTPFWASRTRAVLSLETDAEWLKILQARRMPNLDARLSTPDTLVRDMAGLGRRFDAIVIDAAANRLKLAEQAAALLKPGGFVILDNSDWYPNAAQALRTADLIQVDFHDFRPLHSFRCTSSLFLHPAFRPKPLAGRLPLVPIGGKDVAATNRWDSPTEPAPQSK